MIPPIEESKYIPIMVLNIKARLYNFNNVFVFIKQCIQVYCSYTFSLVNDYSRVDWLSVMKTKPRSQAKFSQEDNNELNVVDDV